jgi:hypothetical protein
VAFVEGGGAPPGAQAAGAGAGAGRVDLALALTASTSGSTAGNITASPVSPWPLHGPSGRLSPNGPRLSMTRQGMSPVGSVSMAMMHEAEPADPRKRALVQSLNRVRPQENGTGTRELKEALAAFAAASAVREKGLDPDEGQAGGEGSLHSCDLVVQALTLPDRDPKVRGVAVY